MVRTGLPPITQDVFDDVEALLNPLEPRLISANMSEHARAAPMLRNSDIAAMLREVPNRSAGDAYGWTYEHVQQTLGHPQALGALKEFIYFVIGGGAIGGATADLNRLRATPT